MVGNHIILAAHSAGLLNVLILGEKKLGVGDPAVALPARNQPAAVRLLRIFGVVDDVADGLSHRAAFDEVEADPNMEKLWRAYQKKFSYAADLSWHTVVESIRSLYRLARAE